VALLRNEVSTEVFKLKREDEDGPWLNKISVLKEGNFGQGVVTHIYNPS
jgi:hypothetical protein